MFTLTQRLDDEDESKEREKHNIQFLEAREDAAEALEPPESRSISFRFLYRARSYSHGSIRFDFGGTTGIIPIIPKPSANCRVSSPS